MNRLARSELPPVPSRQFPAPGTAGEAVAAALHPLHVARTPEEVWEAVLAFLRPRIAHEFIELFLPERANMALPGYILMRQEPSDTI